MHSHDHSSFSVRSQLVGRLVWAAVGLCAVAALVGVAMLWPGGPTAREDPLVLDTPTERAEVVSAKPVACSYDTTKPCVALVLGISSGANTGDLANMEVSAPNPIASGDQILVTSFTNNDGEQVYNFYEFQRSKPIWVLAALFCVAVLALGRWRGLGAIAGLLFSLVLIVGFTLPSVLDGNGAVGVALVSAAVIAFAALFLAHGFNIATAVALLATFVSLTITAVLSWLFVGAANLTGLAGESSVMLGSLSKAVDARGILLAGIVIGALGVLDDVTVTQVSAVSELKKVKPDLTASALVGPAMRIGRDHISSTVNTLFLAYAGAALPLLLLFTRAGQGFGDVVTREVVAVEVVRALVGSIGLISAVPISTWLAALVVGDPEAHAHDEHTHDEPVTEEDDCSLP